MPLRDIKSRSIAHCITRYTLHDILTKLGLMKEWMKREACPSQIKSDRHYSTSCKWNGRKGSVICAPKSWICCWNGETKLTDIFLHCFRSSLTNATWLSTYLKTTEALEKEGELPMKSQGHFPKQHQIQGHYSRYTWCNSVCYSPEILVCYHIL